MVKRKRRSLEKQKETRKISFGKNEVEPEVRDESEEDEDFDQPGNSSRNIIFAVIAASLLLTAVFFVVSSWFGEEELPPPPPAPPAVTVLNGCGVSGIAGTVSEYLRMNEINVLNTGNANHSDYAETIVVGRDSLGENAKQVAELLDIANLTLDPDPADSANVVIILGKDYLQFKPFKQDDK